MGKQVVGVLGALMLAGSVALLARGSGTPAGLRRPGAGPPPATGTGRSSALDPGFWLPARDPGATDRRFFASLPDPKTSDPHFLLPVSAPERGHQTPAPPRP